MRVLAGLLALTAVIPAQTTPAARTDENSRMAHQQLLEKTTQGRIDVYFEGDSITRRWGAMDYPQLLENWRKNFNGWNAADFGWGADRIENILWRLENGELDGVNPKVIVLLAGTNNLGHNSVAEMTAGIEEIVRVMQKKAPDAVVVLIGIFPRNDHQEFLSQIRDINQNLSRFANGRSVRFLDINDRLADSQGRLYDGMMNPRDKLHPELKGYQVWADALKPLLTELLGAPAAGDLAPPPTGDPSAAGKRHQ
ncbi:MAG TPA: GDSL-type esterase/lipase family protein [Bryobacteraceae bacterium]|jgi:lysophospholipase L1-like esterase